MLKSLEIYTNNANKVKHLMHSFSFITEKPFYYKFLLSIVLFISILSNTSLVNFSGKGLPLFFLLFPLSLTYVNQKIEKQTFTLFLIALAAQVISYYCLSFNSDLNPGQYLLNMLFALGFILLITILKKYNFQQIAFYTVVIIGTLFLVDSLFSLVNLSVHSRFTLNYLANNPSFGIRTRDIMNSFNLDRVPRITGPWSEPAYSVLPMLTYIFCLVCLFKTLSKLHVFMFSFIGALYSILAGARSFVILLLGLFMFSFLIKILVKHYQKILIKFPTALYLLLLFFTSWAYILLVAYFIDGCSFVNVSFSARFGGMEFALKAIPQHPFLGYGPYAIVSQLQSTLLPICITPVLFYQTAIHSLLLFNLFKFGILSLPFMLFPYIALINVSAREKYPIVVVFSLTLYLISIFTGDYTYFSGYWLLLALLYRYAESQD